MSTTYAHLDNRLGRLRLVAEDGALAGIYLPGQPGGEVRGAAHAPQDAVLAGAARQLAEYFAGGRTAFDLAARPRGTPFQRAVWAALEAIPFGRTRTYGELARAIGRPTASRAVGAANARNPLSIVVPCHRVIAGTGRLQGYGGGLAAKRWLLDHDGMRCQINDRASVRPVRGRGRARRYRESAPPSSPPRDPPE